MDQKIFRKVSMEKLSSTESLDQVMRVVPAKNWMALICLFAIAALTIAWALTGEIARQARGSGMMLSSGGIGAPGEVLAMFSAEDGGAIQAGMEAFITFPSRGGGAVTGRVASLTRAQGQTLAIGDAAIPVASFMNREAEPGDIAALIQLDPTEAAKARKMLATVSPGPVGASMGWFCEVQIVVERFHPVKLILPEATQRDGSVR